MIKNLFAVLMFAFLAISCQNESFDEKTEALDSSSSLTAVLKSMSVNDTAEDNVIDSTSCFKVKLPVEVIANKNRITIVTASQYEDVAAIFNQSQDDEDTLSFVFPVTVEDQNYNETVVNNQGEFDAMIASCVVPADTIGGDCVSLMFPITFYNYNSGFQIQNTNVLNTNKELYTMLQNLGPNEYYSIGYPVSLNVNDGAGVTVNNNVELLAAINNALQGCEQGGCTNPGILVDDLSLYMTFSNGIVKDLKGNAIIVPTDITFTADREGNQNCAVVFNGSQFLQVPQNSDNAIVQGQAYSVSLWFRMQNTNGGDVEKLFSKGSTDGEGFQLMIKELNAPLFSAGNYIGLVDLDWKVDAALPVDTNKWHHLVVTVDADNNVRLYRDGQLRNSQNASGAAIGNEAMDYFIGSGFTGFLDDLRVYKKVLSPADVQVLYELDGDCNTCLE
ncbi:LamG domain-containing protein [Flavobacterium hauense]